MYLDTPLDPVKPLACKRDDQRPHLLDLKPKELTSGEAAMILTLALASNTNSLYRSCTLKYPDVQSTVVFHPPGAVARLLAMRKMLGTTRSVSCVMLNVPI